MYFSDLVIKLIIGYEYFTYLTIQEPINHNKNIVTRYLDLNTVKYHYVENESSHHRHLPLQYTLQSIIAGLRLPLQFSKTLMSTNNDKNSLHLNVIKGR